MSAEHEAAATQLLRRPEPRTASIRCRPRRDPRSGVRTERIWDAAPSSRRPVSWSVASLPFLDLQSVLAPVWCLQDSPVAMARAQRSLGALAWTRQTSAIVTSRTTSWRSGTQPCGQLAELRCQHRGSRTSTRSRTRRISACMRQSSWSSKTRACSQRQMPEWATSSSASSALGRGATLAAPSAPTGRAPSAASSRAGTSGQVPFAMRRRWTTSRPKATLAASALLPGRTRQRGRASHLARDRRRRTLKTLFALVRATLSSWQTFSSASPKLCPSPWREPCKQVRTAEWPTRPQASTRS
mmetsp:Transcript_96306/g.281351  ORF Transcript_96306/g.281351 Transcript_96306/m.281351 type:complete len:299 (+) Transcript_96306:1027-1923(+)